MYTERRNVLKKNTEKITVTTLVKNIFCIKPVFVLFFAYFIIIITVMKIIIYIIIFQYLFDYYYYY